MYTELQITNEIQTTAEKDEGRASGVDGDGDRPNGGHGFLECLLAVLSHKAIVCAVSRPLLSLVLALPLLVEAMQIHQ